MSDTEARFSVLVALEDLLDSGEDPPYSLDQIRQAFFSSKGLHMSHAEAKVVLRGLAKSGLVKVVRIGEKKGVYPLGTGLVDTTLGMRNLPQRPGSPGIYPETVGIEPDSQSHEILAYLGISSPSRRIDIEKEAGVSFKDSARPLELLLRGGLIEHPTKEQYLISDSGRRALEYLEEGQRFVVSKEEKDPYWDEYFKTRKW